MVRSCIKMHATRESWIAYRGWIIRASRCTLHSKWITLLTVDNALFEKTHAKITTLYFVPCVVWSCIEMHATRESWITYRGWIIRATSCTLRGNRWIAYRGWIFRASRCTLHSKWITLLTVDNTLFEKTHAKITALCFVPFVNHSCNKLHATRESWIAYRGWLFVQQDARYEGIVNHASGLNHSCNKLHATRESWITYRGWFIRATSCTLRGVKDARYGHCITHYRYE